MKPPVKPFTHPCQAKGCSVWGTYGYGVDLLKGRAGRWYCALHRPSDEMPAATAEKSA